MKRSLLDEVNGSGTTNSKLCFLLTLVGEGFVSLLREKVGFGEFLLPFLVTLRWPVELPWLLANAFAL